jgi:hypothetical protein
MTQPSKQIATRPNADVTTADAARAVTGGRLGSGEALMRVGGSYQTAVMVQVKRDIGTPTSPGGSVLQRSVTEAQLLGDRFFYGWDVNDRQSGGKKSIEGISVDGAYMLLRNWTNAVCDVDLVATDEDAYTFKSMFVDLESGATCSRLYRQHRSPPPGKYDKQRWDDMAFSNGQSRAIRNVICAALPQWLQDRCMDVAQRAAEGGGPRHEARPQQGAQRKPEVVPQEAAGSTASAVESSSALANKYASLLRQSWGQKELDEVVSQIKRDEQKIDARSIGELRTLYRKQLTAYEQSMPKDEYVPDAEFSEGDGQ